MTAVKSLSLPDQFKSAIALVERSKAISVIANKQEYDKANADYRDLIQHEKELDVQYAALECVIQAKAAQVQKKDLAAQFDAAKKHLKNGPMLQYDKEQERILREEESRQQAEAQRLADIETARLVAEQKVVFEKAKKTRKEQEAIANKSKDAAVRAQALADAERAKEGAARAAQTAKDIKADAAAAPAPTVVIEKTHSAVSRRKVFKWRLTTKDGRKFTKAEFTSATRLTPADLGKLPSHLFVLSSVLLNEFVDSGQEAAAIPGTLEIKSEML